MDTDAQAWAQQMLHKLQAKMPYAVEKARAVPWLPYTTQGEAWQETPMGWWTNGFWPATMWQLFRLTGDSAYRDEALRAEGLLDAALRDFKHLDHDVGFLWLPHAGVHYRLERNPDSFDRLLLAANLLAGRFNPNGFIRAWNGTGREGWAIIDCLMNLPLLHWASAVTGDPRYGLIARRHTDTVRRCFLRADGSADHIVVFHPVEGTVLERPAGQGYASGSSWSRGQAWTLYGFTLSYLCTGNGADLAAARAAADYFLSHLGPEGIPPCDFCQPREVQLWDDAAGNIAASGLLTLAKYVDEPAAQRYTQGALRLLQAQEAAHADWSQGSPAIFTHCTTAYHDKAGHHIPMHYADYFFTEAVGKLLGETLLPWCPEEDMLRVR